jgi:hypothetical protein
MCTIAKNFGITSPCEHGNEHENFMKLEVFDYMGKF